MIPAVYTGTEFEVVYLDTETTGLDPHTDRLVGVGFAIGDRPARALVHDRDRELVQRVLDADAVFVGHNLGFDMHFLEAAGYRIPDPARWMDTQLLAHVTGVNGERRDGNTALARLTARLIESAELGADILEPEAEIKRWLRVARRQARKEGRPAPEKGDAPLELLQPYLKADLISTRAVHRHYSASLNGQAPVLELERRCMPVIYATEARGVPIDVDEAHAIRGASVRKLQDLRARLFELAGKPFSLDSSQQLEPILTARNVDLTGALRTPTGLLTRSAQALELIDDELVRTLLEHRTERVFHGLLDSLVKRIHGGRLHTSFRALGSDTGRMSSSRPNMQNVPKTDLRIRHVIRAGAGKVLVGADLDNVEMRVLACYAPGGALEQAFRAGADLHQQTADAVGVSRDIGKRLNYAVVYGGGAPLFSKILDVELEEARAFLDRWYHLYPEVGRLRRGLVRTVERRGYLETIVGRRHHFEQANHMLINRLISGGCADLFKRAAIALHAAKVPLVLLVHDEMVAEVDEDDADRVAALLEAELTRPAQRKGASVHGLVAKAVVVERWSQMKDPEFNL